MGLKTDHKILINGSDVFAKLESKPISITITDERDFASDRAEVVINNAKNISVPSKDAEMIIYINNSMMGKYKVTSISLSSENGYTLTIQASGIDFKNKFKDKISRTFSKENNNNKIQDVVETVASTNGYKAIVSETLKAVELDDIVQTAQSDLRFLKKIAKQFNATVKANNDTIMMIERTKHNLPSKRLPTDKILSFSMTSDSLYNFNSVAARYTDIDNGGTQRIQIGKQEPTFTIDRTYKSLDMAKKVLQKKLTELSQKAYSLNLTLEGDEELQAESGFEISNKHELVDGKWSADVVTHKLDSSGFITTIKASSVEN